ncbi:hypothetical protein KUTeg_012341 [Tegillarca granosa]|uniref:Uncharacterized protein n=1 Tax=Tegillarca granosa TaxID=220873 RepID=A0ABQ9EZ92_TEGGR|nr:hypothetical protein KUTeg_012341 [Tegillarca granosa]
MDFYFGSNQPFEERINTFNTWPQYKPCKMKMAHAGFVFTGQSDITECPSCKLKLHNWLRNDNPVDEHLKHSPTCIYLKVYGINDFDIYNANNTEVDMIY